MRNSKFARLLRQEWNVTKMANCADSKEPESDEATRPRIFRNMPRAMQASWSTDWNIAVPEGYFGVGHCNTKWILNVLTDGADTRLLRLLKQGRTRIMFHSDMYYQMVDQPSVHIKSYRMDKPMFNSKALLFMNAFGIAIYLHQFDALKQLARQRKDNEPMVNARQQNFATCINDHSTGDVVRFSYDYIMLKREAYKSIPFLLEAGWEPGSASMLVYRRRYFQYVTPFTDWVDVCRNVLRSKPSLQLSKVMQELVQSRCSQFRIDELQDMGEVMVEYVELKQLQPENFDDEQQHGKYAGRKLQHNKDSEVPKDYSKVFNATPVRPVMPHAVSAPRRFLCYTYYYDHENLTTLSQILSVTEVFQQNRYFSCDTECKSATWHYDPLLFQIHEIINMEQDGQPLRKQNWSNTIASGGMMCWYRRFDILNCIALVFGILQNCLLKNFSGIIIDRICRLLLDIMANSEFIEPFLNYSFYDTYYALTSLVNSVPNLQPSSVMRMMKKAPQLLTKRYTIPQISDMFSQHFWSTGHDTTFWRAREKDANTVGEFLVTRKRHMSMMETAAKQQQAETKSEGADENTSTILLFTRSQEDMRQITQAEEEAKVIQQTDFVYNSDEEQEHNRWYTRLETDFRYASLFQQDFQYAVMRPKVKLDETRTLADNIKISKQPNE